MTQGEYSILSAILRIDSFSKPSTIIISLAASNIFFLICSHSKDLLSFIPILPFLFHIPEIDNRNNQSNNRKGSHDNHRSNTIFRISYLQH